MAPHGEPPRPGAPASLDEFTERLKALREWANVRLRALSDVVETEISLRKGSAEQTKPAYATLQNLFGAHRKRHNEELLFDVVRGLLRQAQPTPDVLEKQVMQWREAYRSARGLGLRTDVYPGFRLGPLVTSCQLLEGNGERPILEHNVRVLVDPVDVALPPIVKDLRDEVVIEQSRRRDAGLEYFWHAPRYAVKDFVVTRTGLDEAPEVTLHLKHSDYFTFIATQKLDLPLPNGATLRGLYLHGRHPRDVPDFMRSSFGLNVAVVTADEWLVVARRSDRVGVGKNVWNSSANEGLQRQLDSPDGRPPNLFRAAERGVLEELRITPEKYDLALLAFAVVTSNSQWCGLFLARLNTMTRRQFEENLGRGAQDAWENQGFDFVRFQPGPTVSFLLDEDRRESWAPAAVVLFYLSLVNAYGHHAVDQVVADQCARYKSRTSPNCSKPPAL
ncbi:hypothetical protein ALI144C_40160 [Actinosynnema sp. ALI-1.44]|nr:hypothetical protein ALI144C_40160 [Actinosynnema sp. ALI-1.44]